MVAGIEDLQPVVVMDVEEEDEVCVDTRIDSFSDLDEDNELVPFPRSGNPVADHGDGSVKLHVRAMEALWGDGRRWEEEERDGGGWEEEALGRAGGAGWGF